MQTLYKRHKDIERKEKILQALKEKSYEVNPVDYKERIKIYDTQKILEDKVCQIVFLENELNIMKKEFEERREEVLKNIEKIDNELYKDILFLRYICFMEWDEISEKLGYSKQHTFLLHKKALKAIKVKS